jgi:broad specificity phosphatase PhoE
MAIPALTLSQARRWMATEVTNLLSATSNPVPAYARSEASSTAMVVCLCLRDPDKAIELSDLRREEDPGELSIDVGPWWGELACRRHARYHQWQAPHVIYACTCAETARELADAWNQHLQQLDSIFRVMLIVARKPPLYKPNNL